MMIIGDLSEEMITPSFFSVDTVEDEISGQIIGDFSRDVVFPEQIQGVALYLDAFDDKTITLNGPTVSKWKDKSKNQYETDTNPAAEQPTRVTSPPALAFDGTSDFMKISSFRGLNLTADYTIFFIGSGSQLEKGAFIAMVEQVTGWYGILIEKRGDVIGEPILFANRMPYSFVIGGDKLTGLFLHTTSVSQIFTFLRNLSGGEQSMRVNGANKDSIIPTNVAFADFNHALIIGARGKSGGNLLSGLIQKIVIYNRALSEYEITLLQETMSLVTGITLE
jgi:hypothetical protein